MCWLLACVCGGGAGCIAAGLFQCAEVSSFVCLCRLRRSRARPVRELRVARRPGCREAAATGKHSSSRAAVAAVSFAREGWW